MGFNFWLSTFSVSIGWVNITPIGNAVSVALTALHTLAYLYDIGVCINEAWDTVLRQEWDRMDETYELYMY